MYFGPDFCILIQKFLDISKDRKGTNKYPSCCRGSVSQKEFQGISGMAERGVPPQKVDGQQQPVAPVPREEAEGFRSALERRPSVPRHDAESGAARPGRREQPAADPSSVSSLFSQGALADFARSLGVEQAAPAEPAPAPAALSGAELESLVDRILVSTPGDGSSEVRITLGDKALPDTEIILTRDRFGELKVSLMTTDSSSFQTLVSSRMDLQERLQLRENGPVRVEVSDLKGGEQSGSEGDSRRRSRGLDYAQQQEG